VEAGAEAGAEEDPNLNLILNLVPNHLNLFNHLNIISIIKTIRTHTPENTLNIMSPIETMI